MATTMRFCIVIALCYFNEIFAQECKKDEHAILGMMLRRHTFKTMKSSFAVECNRACNDDSDVTASTTSFLRNYVN